MSKIKQPDLSVIALSFNSAYAYMTIIRNRYKEQFTPALAETQDSGEGFVFCYKNENDKLVMKPEESNQWCLELHGEAVCEIFKSLKPEDLAKQLALVEPPAYKPYAETWVYPVAAVVVRHLKMEGVNFPKVIHAYVPIDEKKYNIADDAKRKNPTLLEQELKRELEMYIHEFKKQFVEFKNADFDILFIMPDQTIKGW